MLRVIMLIAFLLIQGYGFSMNGPDSCRIVVIGHDTFISISPNQIAVSNFVKVAMDRIKDPLETIQGENRTLKTIVKNDEKTINDLFEALGNRNKALGDCREEREKLNSKVKFRGKVITGLIVVAIMEAAVIYLIK